MDFFSTWLVAGIKQHFQHTCLHASLNSLVDTAVVKQVSNVDWIYSLPGK